MMARAAGIVWTGDKELQNKIKGAPEAVQRRVAATMEFFAPQVETRMKTNAPWTDQTGNARQGLAARAFREGDVHGIDAFHQVPYGIWLEVKYSGKYAIISPTVQEMGPQVMAALSTLLEEI